MRILYVGWGFSPWREGGLIAYAEDLMDAQVGRGHEVSYFFSGRHYPYISGPRLKRWRRRGVGMHEAINPPIIPGLESGTRAPELELSEPRLEAAFERVMASVRPDVVHIQELHGLPSTFIELAGARAPTVMTLHDYGPLCATLRLFDSQGRICMRRDVGADCVLRNADAPLDPGLYVDITLRFETARARRAVGLGESAVSFLEPIAAEVRRWVIRTSGRTKPGDTAGPRNGAEQPSARAVTFQRRRDLNVERLGKVDRLLAQSSRLAEIYRTLGVSGARMTVLPGPPSHIERLRPRRLSAPPSPVIFATLNGCVSPSKGSQTVVTALRTLRGAGLERSFRLRVLGHVDEAAREELLDHANVEVSGPYGREELGALLDDVDVGIVPSMWEEAYCYTGLEMIAKGIPLIANPLGGIVQYAHEGRTAWLNRACSGEGLAELMARVIGDPQGILDMHQRVIAARDELITPWADHVDALEAVYHELAPGT
jgi:glycosyltransferase involved in cell wall biosynthesis